MGHEYWIFGGYHQDRVQPDTFVKMAKYDILSNSWTKATDSGPSNRDGHTLTAFQVMCNKCTILIYYTS